MRYLILLIFLGLCTPVVADVDPNDHTEARAFVKAAVLEQVEGHALSASTRDLLLSADDEGHPLSFIPDCPICLGVQDALRELEVGPDDEGLAAGLSAEKASTRTSSLARLVRQAVQAKLATIDDMQQRIEMAEKLKAGSEEGQRQLARYQSRKVEAYKMMWSCLMCDAAAKES
jgi:regulator of protease activity HflC (stomatin/prohibitin superfamily)